MKQILCLSTQPWSSSPGRTQQLISRLKDVQVLYFSPAPHWRDRSWKERGRQVRPNITVYTLPPLLLPAEERYGKLFILGQRKLGRFVAEKAARHRFRQPLLWTTGPEQVHLLDQLDYSGLVYDCDREWVGPDPRWEGTLAHAADLVFAASPLLADRLSPCSSNIALLPNGVNYPLFANEAATPGRAPLIRADGPILGWAGTIRPDLDLTPILAAAQARPGWTFLLLGRREGNPLLPRLERLDNVVLAGPCPMSQVPDWLYRCDVLVDLLAEDRGDDGVVSTRLYEYLATGKPVVSMVWPGQEVPFPGLVHEARNEAEFLTRCAQALAEGPTGPILPRRDRAAQAAWPLRAAQVSRILETAGLL